MNQSIKYKFREATLKDIPFLVETIIEAEKSGTNILTYTTVFGLDEKETRKYLTKMLEEQVDGCELSVSSFTIAEFMNNAVAAISAWIEAENGISSSILKGNLLTYTLPSECIERSIRNREIIRSLHIENSAGALLIGLVYVTELHRGKNLTQDLIRAVTEKYSNHPMVKHSFIQVFGNNSSAIKAYEKAGYKICLTKTSSVPNICQIMPHYSKVLMGKEL